MDSCGFYCLFIMIALVVGNDGIGLGGGASANSNRDAIPNNGDGVGGYKRVIQESI